MKKKKDDHARVAPTAIASTVSRTAEPRQAAVTDAERTDRARETANAASMRLARDGRAKCEWVLTDDDTAMWETTCGQAWTFIDGGPVQNHVRFCHYCGGRVITPIRK